MTSFSDRVKKLIAEKGEFIQLKSMDESKAILVHPKWGEIPINLTNGSIDASIDQTIPMVKVIKEYLSGEMEANEEEEARVEANKEEEKSEGSRPATRSYPLHQAEKKAIDAVSQFAPALGGFRPATRSAKKLRLAITGPSGAGKTMSALLVAYGIIKDWSKIGLIDTESGSGDLYTGTKIGNVTIGKYNVLTFEPPFTPDRYIEAIEIAENAGLEVVIIDSLSHGWEGQGGALEMHDDATAASKSQNSYFAWKNVTPLHRAMIEKIKHSKIHVIATMRSKTEYVIGDGNAPKKVGLAPIQRAGTEHEFDAVFAMDQETHQTMVSKDRTHLFGGKNFIPDPSIGEMLLNWLNTEV